MVVPMLRAGVGLFAAGLAWRVYVDWLRHRPHNLTRGTRHLALAGTLGQVVLMAAGLVPVVMSGRLAHR